MISAVMAYTSKAAEEDATLLFESLHDPRFLGMGSFPTLFAQPQNQGLQARLRALYRTQEDVFSSKTACNELLKLYEGEEGKCGSTTDSSLEVRESTDISFGDPVEQDQAQRDLERDRLIIDGIYMTGAEVRYAAARNHLASLVEVRLRDRLPKGRGDLGAFSVQVSEKVLLKSSRTFTGGASYTALAQNLKADEAPVPLSDKATPIRVRLTISATPSRLLARKERDVSLGVESLVIEIDTTTVFLVKRILSNTTDVDSCVNLDTEDRTVRVTYNDSVIVPIEPLRSSAGADHDGFIYPGERVVNIYGL